MGTYRMLLAASLLCISLVGCSSGWPQSRLGQYLGSTSHQSGTPMELVKQGEIKAGLFVINDTSAPNSAPQLSDESFDSINKHVQARLLQDGSMALVRLDSPSSPHSPVQLESLIQMANDQQLEYLVLAVVSSTEIEVPDRLPLGGSLNGGGLRGWLNGYRAQNFALAELVLLDVGTGRALLQSDGQAWASLERLAVPLESNVYPVVRRYQDTPPIYPTSEDRAHDVMRAVASSEAINQAVMHFSESWKKVRG